MKKILLAVPVLIAALMLVGCGQGTSDPDASGSSTTSSSVPVSLPAGGDSGGSNTQPDPTASKPADEATLAYVACLNEHGLNAIVGPDGTVQYAVTENDLGPDGKPVSPGSGADKVEVEALCQQAVPGYAPPDYNEK